MSEMGQKRKISPGAHVVRFTPESRHSRAISASPLGAISGHRSKKDIAAMQHIRYRNLNQRDEVTRKLERWRELASHSRLARANNQIRDRP